MKDLDKVTLLIVDDELPIREGLVECIDWASLGIDVIGSAEDGREALDLCSEETPDILLTDVVMPGVDGMKLVTQIQESYSCTPRIIFMSAYQDIEYLKSAFKHDAVDYLLKPINIGELTEVVMKTKDGVISERERDRKRKDEAVETARIRLQARRVIAERSLRDFIECRPADTDLVMELLKTGGLTLDDESAFTALLVDPIYSGLSGLSRRSGSENSRHGEHREKIRRGIARLLAESRENILGCQSAFYDFCFSFFVLFVQGRDAGMKAAETMFRFIRSQGLSATIAVGGTATGLAGIRESYRLAQNVLSAKFVKGGGKILCAKSGSHDLPAVLLKEDDNGFAAVRTELLDAAALGDSSEVIKSLDTMFRLFEDSGIAVKQYACSICAELIHEAAERIESLVGSVEALDGVGDAAAMFDSEDILHLKRMCTDTLIGYCGMVRRNRPQAQDRYTQAALIYIEAMYGRDISVEDVSRHVGISPSYLQAVFRGETGLSVHEYIDRKRMAKARDSLCMTDARISEIAVKVGFRNAGYFSKRFRLYNGMSPGEYRHRNRER